MIVAGGIIWFDYLNVIDAKTLLSPVFSFFKLPGRSREPAAAEADVLNLDAERLFVRMEALDLRDKELDQRELDIQNRRGEISQMAQELEARQKSLDEREISLNASAREAENKERNVEQNARYLTGMPPERAVGIIAAMDDQDAIDVFRKTEEIAQAEGTTSMVSVWLMNLPPERAAELQRKMAGRPPSLNQN